MKKIKKMSSLLSMLLSEQINREKSQQQFIEDFIKKFDPTEPMFIRALKSIYTVDTKLEETREISFFFMKKGLCPPKLDEWSIVLGAAAAKILVKECFQL